MTPEDGILASGITRLTMDFGTSGGPTPLAVDRFEPTPSDPIRVNFSDPYQHPLSSAGGFSRDPFQLDGDPDGTRTVEYGRRIGKPYTNTDVLSLNVFGREMGYEQLNRTDSGRRLLEIAQNSRKGRTRGFWDALTDFSLSDIPFLGMIASVGSSVSEAVTVSDTMKKLQNGEAVSDDDLIKTRLYMAENEWRQTGGFGAMVGDIVRAAPGFMAEFAFTGNVLGFARAGAAKLAKDSAKWTAVLAVDRSKKILARELFEDVLQRRLAKETAETTSEFAARRAFRDGAAALMKDSAARKDLVREIAGGLLDNGVGPLVPKGIEREVAEQLAETAVNRGLAAKGASNAFMRFANGTVNHLKEWTARGLLDHGHFGSEESTVMFTKHTKAGQALVDALGAFTVEAHVRGGLMFLPVLAEHGVSKVNEKLGSGDRLLVGRGELGQQEAALRQGSRSMMDTARSIGLGIDFMEYVSENAGRGFGPLMRSVGLKLGIAPAARQVIRNEAGTLVQEASALESGGFLRQLIRKAVGTTDDVKNKIAAEENRAFARAVNTGLVESRSKAGLITEAEAARIIASGSTSGLEADVAAVIGKDVRAFSEKALASFVETETTERAFKSMTQIRLLRWMANHDLGPDAVMNAFDRMGYDGILGEMFEERYSDFEKGLLGWDDKTFNNYGERIVDTVKNIYPGFDQLLAEAVGFAVPGVVRTGITVAQKSLTGGVTAIDRDRHTAQSISSALNSLKHVQMTRGDFETAVDANVERLGAERDRAVADRDAASAKITEFSTDAERNRLKSLNERVAYLDSRIERQQAHKKSVLAANTVEGAAEANASDLIWVQAIDTAQAAGDFATDKANVTRKSEQIASDAGALQRGRDGLVDLAMDIVESKKEIEKTGIDRKTGIKQLGFWRWAGTKALGIAGAAVTGEIGLAFRNSSSWIGVDEGLPQEFVRGITELAEGMYDSEAALMRKEIAETSTGSQTDHVIREDDLRQRVRAKLDGAVKNYLDTWLAISGTRFVANTRGEEQALTVLRETQGWEKRRDGSGFAWFDKSGDRIDEETFRKEVDAVKSQIAIQTYSLLTRDNLVDGSNMSRDQLSKIEALNAVMFADPMAPGRDLAIRQIAMNNLGYRSVHVVSNIDDNTSLSDSLQSSGFSVREESLRGLLAAADEGRTETDDFDKMVLDLARQMGFPEIDGTDEQIKALKAGVTAAARQLAAAVDARSGSRTYSKAKPTTADNGRFYDAGGNNVRVVANRMSDGVRWEVTVTGKDGKAQTKRFADQAALDAEMNAAGFGFVSRPIVLTNVGAVVTNDGMCLARKLGLAEDIFNATKGGARGLAQVHPYYRRKTDGSNEWAFATPEAAEAQFQKELRLAWFFSVNGGETPNLAAYDSLIADPARRGDDAARREMYETCRVIHSCMFGEGGYVSTMNAYLSAQNVACPTEEQYYLAYETGNRSAARYVAQTTMMAPRTREMPYVISVDYGRMQDYSSAFLAVTTDAVLEDKRYLFEQVKEDGSRTGIRKACTDMIGAVNAILEAEIRIGNHTKAELQKLNELNRALVNRDKSVTMHAISEVIRYVAFFQAEITQDKNPGIANPGGHDAAWLMINRRVRDTQQYLAFMSAVDVMFGGDGFGILLARGMTGEKNVRPSYSGIVRMLDIYGIPNGESFDKAISQIRPAGMTTDEFTKAVSAKARFVGREGVTARKEERQPGTYGGKIGNLANAVSNLIAAANVTDYASMYEALSKLGNKLSFNKDQKNSYAVFLDTVRKIGAEQEALIEQSQRDKANIEAQLETAKSNLARMSAAGESDRKARAEAEKKVSDLQEQLQAAIKAGKAAEASKGRFEQELALYNQKKSEEAQKAGENNPTPKKGRGRNKPRGRVELLDTSFVDLRSFSSVTLDGMGQYMISEGLTVASELGAETKEGRETRKVGCAAIAAAFRHIRGETVPRKLSESEFTDAARRMFGYNIRDVELQQMYREYERECDAGRIAQYNVLSDRPGNDQNDDEIEDKEDNTQGDAYGTDKAKAAFDDDALKRFLTFASFANPATYREFQAFSQSLRTSVKFQFDLLKQNEAGKDEHSRVYRAYEFLDRLLNPRSQVGEAGRSAVDRQSQFAALCRELETGEAGMTFSDILMEISGYDENGFVRSKPGTFLLSYLNVLSPEARQEMMTLVCSTCDSSLGTMDTETVYEKDSDGRYVVKEKYMTMRLERNRTRFVSERAITSSFLHLLSVKDLRSFADSLRKDLAAAKWVDYRTPNVRAMPNAYDQKRFIADYTAAYVAGMKAYNANAKTLSDILAKYFGRDSAICEVLDNPRIASSLIGDLTKLAAQQGRKVTKKEKESGNIFAGQDIDLCALSVSPRSAANRNLTGGYATYEVPLAATVLDIIDELALIPGGGLRREEDVARIVTAAFTYGIGKNEGGLARHKQLSVGTPWLRMFEFHAASFPETLTQADLLPDRSTKTSATMAAAVAGCPPVIESWLDRSAADKGSFAWYAFRKIPVDHRDMRLFQGVTDEKSFDEKVMPWVRQNMCWPDVYRTPILFKNRARDYNKNEALAACRNMFDRQFSTGALQSWVVPVYNGDHSGGVYLRVPQFGATGKVKDKDGNETEVRTFIRSSYDAEKGEYTDVFTPLANKILSDMGLDKLANDSKRSATTSSEAPGRACYGTRHVNGKVVRGKTYMHLVHNYALDENSETGQGSHNDCLKGNIPCIGYGPKAQAACAKDRDSQIQKLHFMSPSGVDLEFFKGLSVWQDKDSARKYGSFARGTFNKWAYDWLKRYSEGKDSPDAPADLSSHYMLDEDALKVSVLNSKAMGVAFAEERRDESGRLVKPAKIEKTLMAYIFEKMKQEALGEKTSWSLEELSKLLDDGKGDGKFAWYTIDAKGVHEERKSLDELLGFTTYDDNGQPVIDGATGKPKLDGSDIEARLVKTENGQTVVDLVYTDPGLMSYRVANVSHTSKPEVGRAARNNVVDALTMATVQLRGKLGSPDSHPGLQKFIDFVADYGVLVTAMTSDNSFVQAIEMGPSQRLKELRDAGVKRGGMHWNDKLAYEVFARMKKMIGVNLFKVDCALNTSGALYDKNLNGGRGGWVDWSQDDFFRALNKGSRVFSDKRRDGKFNGIERRLASCRVNVDDPGFRYMMRLADDFAEQARAILGKAKDKDGNEYDVADRIVATSATPEMDIIERCLLRIRETDFAYDSDMENAEAETAWRKNRATFLSMFTDHHGHAIREDLVEKMCFDDLFIHGTESRDGMSKSVDGRIFDRSAVFDGRDDEDYIPEFGGEKSTGAKRPVWLMGSSFGIPRTPSYNGSMWLQVCRASVPCTEIAVDEEKNEYRVGKDAMVMPDPQTLEILGCDSDGDKAQVYLLGSDLITGLAKTADLRDDVAKNEGFATDAEARSAYLERMVARGVIAHDKEGFRFGSEEDGDDGDFRIRMSNTYVQALLDMNRNLKVDLPNGERDGSSDYDFYRTRMARATKMQPLEEAEWAELKAEADQAKNYLLGHVIAEIDTACAVSTSAGMADQARGRIVSLALLLHLAQFSGKFFEGSRNGVMFRWVKEDIDKWIDFIYGVDGLSNATFDDIKEQICLQLGWEPDMVESIVADLIVSGEKAPTNSKEFLEVFRKHIVDIKEKKPRYWASVSANPATDGTLMQGHLEINEMFNPKSKSTSMNIRSKDDVRNLLGIQASFTDGGLVYGYGDEAVLSVLRPEARAFTEAFKADVAEHNPSGEYENGADDCALKTLVDGVSARRGRNAMSGMLYGSLKQIAGGADAAVVVREFRQWAEGMRILTFARDFTSSIMFLKADPGSATYLTNADRLVKAFNEGIGGTEDPIVDSALRNMMIARRTAGELRTKGADGRPQHLNTIHSRMTLAKDNRSDAVVDFAVTVAGMPRIGADAQDLAAKLMMATKQTKAMSLEGNAQTVQFLLAALQTTPEAISGTDVMSKNGGLDAWKTLRAIADGTADLNDFTRETVKGKKYGDTIDLCNGFAAMFNVMSSLWTTGDRAAANPAFGYFNTRGTYDGLDLATYDENLGKRDVRTIGLNFRQKDSVSYERARGWVREIANGAIDPGKRGGVRHWSYVEHDRTTKDNKVIKATATPAADFSLSIENLNRFSSENLDPALQRDISTVRTILENIKTAFGLEKDVVITPSSFFNQFLPIYSTMTQRVLGAPSPANKSILGLLPGVFERLSERQAEYEAGMLEPKREQKLPGRGLLDAVLATNHDVVNFGTMDRLVNQEGGKFADPTERSFGNRKNVDTGLRIAADLAKEKTRPDNLLENDALHRWRAEMSERDDNPDAMVRGNPDGEHLVDVFGNGGLLRSLHAYANTVVMGYQDKTGSEPPKGPTEPVPTVPEGTKNERIQRFADHIQAILPYAEVRYTGGNTVEVTGGFRGSMAKRFGGGKMTNFCMEFRIGNDPMVSAADGFMNVSNPAFIASFCEATRGCLRAHGFPHRTLVDAEHMMRSLTKEERVEIVKAMGGFDHDAIRGFTAPKPTWSIDMNGIATLCGYSNITDAEDYATAYHELFHNMIGMFRTMGVFGEDDVKALRRRFGEGARGTGELFDEEAAAEAFRKYVERKITNRDGSYDEMTNTKDDETGRTYGIFKRLWEKLVQILNGIRMCFSYSDGDAEDNLFGMVLTGHAIASVERRAELGGGTTEASFLSDVEGIADQTRTRDAMANYLKAEYPDAFGDLGDPAADAEHARRALRQELRTTGEEYSDPMDGYEMGSDAERELSKLLIEELHRQIVDGVDVKGARISAVADIIGRLIDIRGLRGAEPEDGRFARLRLSSLAEESAGVEARRRYGEAAAYVKDNVGRLRGLSAEQRQTLAKYLNTPWNDRTDGLTADALGVLGEVGIDLEADTLEYDPVERELKAGLRAGVSIHMDSIYGPVQNVLSAALNVGRIGTEESGWSEIVSNVMNGELFTERRAALSRMNDEVKRIYLAKMKRLEDVARLGVKHFKDATGDSGDSNLLYRSLLTVYRDLMTVSSRSVSGKDKAFSLAGRYGENREFTHGKMFHGITANDYAGALVAYSGTGTEEIYAKLRARIEAVARSSSDARVNGVCQKLLGNLSELEKFDVMSILETPKAFSDLVDDVIADVMPGIRRGDWDPATGTYGDYVNDEVAPTKKAGENMALYDLENREQAAETATVQKLLGDFMDTTFTVYSAVKFWRESGLQPGTFHDSAFRGDTVETIGIGEICDRFGIGADQATSEAPMFDPTCRPEFVIGNFDGWFASTMADRIGKMDFRTAAMKNAGKFRGALAKLTRAENFIAHLYGMSRADGRKLFTLHTTERGFEFGDGFYHRLPEPLTDEERKSRIRHGFNIYGNIVKSDTTDYEFTLDQQRLVDAIFKARTMTAGGYGYLVTGVSGQSGLRFGANVSAKGRTRRMSDGTDKELLPSEDPAYYSWENVERIHKAMDRGELAGNQVPPIVLALWNLKQQWFGSVTGRETYFDRDGNEVTFGLDLYNRFVEGIVKGIRKANAVVLKEDGPAIDPFGDGAVFHDPKDSIRTKMENAGHEMTSEDYNDIVLESLERDGLVICDYKDTMFDGGNGRVSFTGGVRNRNVGALVISVEELEREFKKSSAYDVLCRAGRDVTVNVNGHDVSMLSSEYHIHTLMAPYKEALAEVRKNPWLTEGDGGYFNNVGTPLQFVEGGGAYMLRANRAMRKTKYEQILTIGAEEKAFEKTIVSMMRTSDIRTIQTESVSKLNMLSDYYGLDQSGDELRAAIMAGKYEPGSAGSVRTGLELSRTCDGMDIARAIYYKVLEKKIDALDGKPGTIPEESLDRMIAMYEEATDDIEVSASGKGMTPGMMFRLHGALPKNFQLGHHLHQSLKGITDALAFRSTLLNMLFLHGPNGKPMCFARPTDDAVERGGLSDDVWMAVARNLEAAYGIKADNMLTGVKRAQRAYDVLHESFKELGWKTDKGLRIHSLGDDDMDCRSVSGFMAVDDDPFDDNESDINRTKFTESTAFGYAKQLFQSSRVLGGTARTQWIQRVLSWSKSASVAYSFFFPIATRWESPTGAVGFLATLGSNLSPDFVRKHSEGLNSVQKLFTLGRREGWLDQDFIGIKDIIRMMDTDDPFLADLVTWAESLNITMTDRLSNPLEPTKGIVEDDIRRMGTILREMAEAHAGKAAGAKMERRFTQMAEALFMRSGDRAFTYALNATKLAVTCQLAMKLKKEAEARGKAFDPIRDLAKYATYIDSEIGGVNPLRYAWAHPMMRKALSYAFFSWEWTRTAWEAGGGGVLEDMLFGGHTFTKQERKYIVGRWLRMFGSIMIGVPMFTQLASYLMARSMGWKDDDDSPWTWDNEDKTRWTAADITPLMKALGDQRTSLGQVMRMLKSVPVVGNFIPAYTGEDEANQAGASKRRYYIHMGKQGWEFFRWFTEPVGQVFSKLSMPTQRMLEGILGRSPSYLQRELPFSNQSSAQRAIDILNPNGAWANFLQAFVPFTVNGVGSFSDAGFFSMVGPVQMGASQTATLTRIKGAMRKWSMNDRSGYSFGGKAGVARRAILADILEDARRNGHDVEYLQTRAIGQLAPELYADLFKALPKKASDDFDVHEVSRIIRALHRLGVKFDGIRQSIRTRTKAKGIRWSDMPSEDRRLIDRTIRTLWKNPYELGMKVVQPDDFDNVTDERTGRSIDY